MDRVPLVTIWPAVGLAFMLVTAHAEEAPRKQGPAPYAAEMNKKFTDPNADIQQFVKRFENETRDIYAKRPEIAVIFAGAA